MTRPAAPPADPGAQPRPPASRRPHRGPFWTAVLLSAVALVGGLVVAVRSQSGAGGPGAVVRSYLAALQRGDAASALGYGSVPSGSSVLLSARALAAQTALAPITDVRIGPSTTSGTGGTVEVGYVLRFPGVRVSQHASVPVHRAAGGWRLDAVAVPVRITLQQAAQRAALLGGRIPAGPVLAFPGAVPVRLDTGYLALDPASVAVTFGAPSTLSPRVVVSAQGRAAAAAATLRAVRDCVTSAAGQAAIRCPLPGERYVPGSVHGSVTGSPVGLSVSLLPTQVGMLSISATVAVDATYQRLDFDNAVVSGHGPLALVVHAVAVAVDPLHLLWTLG